MYEQKEPTLTPPHSEMRPRDELTKPRKKRFLLVFGAIILLGLVPWGLVSIHKYLGDSMLVTDDTEWKGSSKADDKSDDREKERLAVQRIRRLGGSAIQGKGAMAAIGKMLEKYHGEAYIVDLSECAIEDDDLAVLKDLPHIWDLELSGTSVG